MEPVQHRLSEHDRPATQFGAGCLVHARSQHRLPYLGMTAAAAEPPEPGRPPFADTSPAQIHQVLTPEDAADFDRQWQRLMQRATDRPDLTEVQEALESWRRVPWMTSAHGPNLYRKTLASAEQRLRTGDTPMAPSPGTRSKPARGCQSKSPQVTYSIDIDPQVQKSIAPGPVESSLP